MKDNLLLMALMLDDIDQERREKVEIEIEVNSKSPSKRQGLHDKKMEDVKAKAKEIIAKDKSLRGSLETAILRQQ
ncbi:hypothetical protein RYX36_000366 [Vicia faba]